MYNTITDSEGLQRAYQQGDLLHTRKTLFIEGSHTTRDWCDDDVSTIPAWGDSKDSEKYHKVLEAFKIEEKLTRWFETVWAALSLSNFRNNTSTELRKAEPTEHQSLIDLVQNVKMLIGIVIGLILFLC